MTDQKKRRTIAVQTGVGSDPAHHAVMPPLYLSSTYAIEGIDKRQPYEYSRTSNPTRDTLADALTELEGGVGACITSSGMAALTLILHLLNPEDLVIAPYDCYGRAYWLIRALAEKGHFKLKFIDQYSEAALEEALSEPAAMVLIETPSNPVMRIADIQLISDKVKQLNSDALVVVDNTFLSPMLQQPLKLGADIVWHSNTKFLNGHSDVVGGSVITNNAELLDTLKLWNNSLGTIGAPFDSYMTLRGLRTLELRVHRAQENAQKIATFLDNHEKVARVYYPGLKSHAGYEIAQKQQEGSGAMLSFELAGDASQAAIFVEALELFCLAQSLGGTESLINHPASMTHVSMGAEAREKAGVTDQLLRLSIGIEHVDDLIDDLSAALNAL
ncbi:MAG: cystathionine gamma-synthase [Alphaproteobacteria bacterium]